MTAKTKNPEVRQSHRTPPRTVSYNEWLAEATAAFGADSGQWKFRCPLCGHVAAVDDWKAVGAPEGSIAYSCVGRWQAGAKDAFSAGPGPCNYAGGGLFQLNPVTVMRDGEPHLMFEFALPAAELEQLTRSLLGEAVKQ